MVDFKRGASVERSRGIVARVWRFPARIEKAPGLVSDVEETMPHRIAKPIDPGASTVQLYETTPLPDAFGSNWYPGARSISFSRIRFYKADYLSGERHRAPRNTSAD